ncbi:exodeoxyribonuclease V subunit beta [Arsukibacterium sp.]|uniref:exodeoxyribonuclease V subunit beta n=1 Tax=Arsukibacterium sp. TaxID=1977258 RepID=UPI002FD9DC08
MKELDLLSFPLYGSRLIEASAGTGKTFSLALLYVRLVLGHGSEQCRFSRPLTPRDILVLTFTEAATEELRSRVRQRLVEAARLFRQSPALLKQQQSQDPLQQLVISYPDSAWPGCALRLKRAAEAMDEAMIATIHGWCNKMLSEHAFDSRGLFQRELITDQTALLDSIVKDYWRRHFYPLSAQAAEVVQQCYQNPDRLRKALLPLLTQAQPQLLFAGKPFSVTAFSQLQALIDEAIAENQQRQAQQAEFAQLEKKVQALWLAHWPTLEQQLIALQPRFNATKHFSNSDEKFQKMLHELQQWSRAEAPFEKKMANFASGHFVWKKGQAPDPEPTHPAFMAMAELAALLLQHAELDHPAPAADDAEAKAGVKPALLSHALNWCRHELQQRLNQQAQLGFNDLLTELYQALDPALSGEHAQQLANSIRSDYPVALIDEFQDTDPVQYGIFDRIYQIASNDPQSAVVLIGDPKQAIYSFRGADIYTYLQARQHTAGRHYSLSRNFRSTQAVISACNSLFQLAEAQPRAAFRFKSAQSTENPLPFVAVSASGRSEQLLLDAKPLPAVHIEHLSGEDSWRITDYRQHSARLAAARIALLLNAAVAGRCQLQHSDSSRPLVAEDIAVLVRSQHEAQLIKTELAALSVPAVYLSDRGSVFATTEAADVLLWLQACANPMDLGLVKAALAAPSLQLSLQQLMQWQQDELALDAQVQCFIGLQQCWRKQGVLAMLRQLLDQYQLPARLLQMPQGERQLTNLLHLADWLQQQAMQLEGEQALIRQLAEHIDEPGEEQVIRLESDAALVKIITIHKSKGLEYPLVFLPFVVGFKSVDGRIKQVPYRIAANGNSSTGTEIAGRDTFAAAWQQADDQRLSEDMRLLYVALTRARHGIWLGTAAVAVQGKKVQNHQGAFGYLLNGDTPYNSPDELEQQLVQLTTSQPASIFSLNLCADPALQLAAQAQPYQAAATLPELDAAAKPDLAPYQRWWIASYSAIRFSAAVPGSVPVSDESETASAVEPEDAKAALQAELYAEQGQPESPAIDAASDFVMHQLPKGAATGTFIHLLLEWAGAHRYLDQHGQHWSGFAAAVNDTQGRAALIAARCQVLALSEHAAALSDWLSTFLMQQLPLGSASLPLGSTSLQLAALTPAKIAIEMEFLLHSQQVSTRALDTLIQQYVLPGEPRPAAEPEQLHGMLKGFIDLVFEHQGRYYVLDWKTNSLGADDAAYSQSAMQQAMLSHRYDMQFVLYLLALHRLLKSRLADYDYDRHMGGACYWFVRGCREPQQQGLWQYRPERALIEQLDALFSGQAITAGAL